MQAWTKPDIPVVPGPARRLRLYDTASGGLVEVPPGPDGPARMYVCGITPYDATHMGHAATYVTFDLVNRLWRDAGYTVHYTQNITDVDDPLLERATATGVEWTDLAEREIQLFRDDMTALRVIPPQEYVGVVESIPLVVERIAELQQAGAVYDVDGDLYFAVKADPAFGGISSYDADTMRTLFGERGGDPDREGKRDPLDCLVWQQERPGEPAWDSPFGRGRPGWHIECSAIALQYLGMTIDVQGGGSDLIFPHHEMSASEAQCATGQHPFARAYVHQAMVGLDGEKMSKSKGNLVLVSRERQAGSDPMAIRLALLAHHYRTDWFWTDSELLDAQERLDVWRGAITRGTGPDGPAAVDALRAALTNDLDTTAALAAIDQWAETNGDDPEASALVALAVDALLGIKL
ncbi:cysteine/1-D-myo-inosityl 2-amino-2-deoxy-alpha-D-glucopyranoside ligase [Kribbella flavida DSM 17836]|uniref:L-cysteine:1D-myo-inositol 2-amino-2-deoxy-alpha-D-glucopyranoside ligase n=1 Tax=Kribbella flavida (strain DSM 17836 / JCM 10339 / NBRC 14399) TaxID=479435 RepID=MSHC_KRIFD|nr:cysteine--1-D-myo-inosityl 2-amino-2-deoxy-alpha-D-glucopyranoside ligase [Kribbella flavida]D2PPT3.1 RecName: Full=L-cysteine:1D-myo-inositol 2-amino-2-deoxy-alpha-D-glucopyranoside ligase; Short=L-Cys:GlcN-Ins ligase; AltName: Full=Mycothiol ligase; Short=MSH ligase [Kribbella flavida DSM 17836]ADB32857.1 cysteine/1-D-myo-inosityl 2-amino-2-deoxy-alpha-D-glucopyranoside ligase [Kribbella flavida DSM 17836]